MFLNKLNKLLKFNPVKSLINIRCLVDENLHQDIISSYLGVPPFTAQEYVKKHNLDILDPFRFKEVLYFLNLKKYKKEDILNHPDLLLNSRKRSLEHYYYYLEECGFTKITLDNLYHLLRNKTILRLKTDHLIPYTTNVAAQLLEYISPEGINIDISDIEDDDLSLEKVHFTILRQFLKIRLNITNDKFENLMKVHTQLKHRSIRIVCENINIAYSLGFSGEKMVRNGYILAVLPRHTKEVLETIPNFVGADMKAVMRHQPKLMGLPLKQFSRIYNILKEENVSDASIRQNMPIFSLSPVTIQERFAELRQIPETRVLMHDTKVLRLIISHGRAKNNLSFLNQIKLRCASLEVIAGRSDAFENHVKEGKDINKAMEVTRYVNTLLKMNEEEVEKALRKHKFYAHVPFVDIEDTYAFLRTKDFNNNHIKHCIQILLYPKEKIGKILQMMENEEIKFMNSKQIYKGQLLNIVLYFLEKDHYFTGNGIWRETHDDKHT